MGKVIKSAINAVSLGTIDLDKKKKVSASGAVSELQSDAEKLLKQRKALYMTEGGILGEEVEGIGKKKRGSIFGN